MICNHGLARGKRINRTNKFRGRAGGAPHVRGKMKKCAPQARKKVKIFARLRRTLIGYENDEITKSVIDGNAA